MPKFGHVSDAYDDDLHDIVLFLGQLHCATDDVGRPPEQVHTSWACVKFRFIAEWITWIRYIEKIYQKVAKEYYDVLHENTCIVDNYLWRGSLLVLV